jgi:predicted CxxxxCH...CXXCH cytochrome family protein
VNPVSVGDPGHTDTPAPAEVVFGRTASISASPIWDRSAARCSDTYCHGGASPVWTDVGGGQAACGTCHGLPPPSPHPTASACEQCHGQTAGAGMTIAIRDNHVDGIVQLDVNPCLGCHGDTESLAPPPDTMGRTDVSLRTVGAHEAHVIGGTNAKVVECSACHVVPSMTTDPGHLDGAPADVTFSGLALDDSAAPSWDGALLTCSGTYCHGGTMIGGANVDPVWTTVDGSQVACGSCHAIPPPAPHPASMACENCHGPGGASLTIDDPTRHIDGTVDF